ncbi:BTAD domain-containing putative transcriptional regulator [Lentzea sp. NPDC051838]|uniref:AfsR/SARP family transcriptional regulator n=1 Tax=Lentzea sp. NPDC051838 TaxID=3154849 RepID=UPI0034120845
MAVEYRVLGPLEVLLDGVLVPVPAGRCRVLLATLLLRPNQFVSLDVLIERLWEGEPPSSDRAHKTLQMVVTRLRQALGTASCVQTARGGYRASLDPSALDLARFRSLVSRGDFATALGLWRGPMLSDIRSDALHQHDVAPVTEEWLLALERRVAADLAAGRAADLVAELRGLVVAHPFREAFWAQLMLALAESGQQAQALSAYQEVRTLLADELGVDPGADLRSVHQQVLSGSVRVRGPVPRQLPVAVPRFIGRSAELGALGSLTRGSIVAITGTAGVGKTTLAVHWAREIASRFPDGQLYVNLRGFDQHRAPMTCGDALGRFLEGLGVAPDRVPADLDAAAALYRSLVADRRILVLLDNARDAEHVRPLLPGPSSCLVLITSRDRLTGLVVNEGMQQLALDVLSHAEAHALLVSRLGAERVGAADELIKWCGGLPLALAIVAARAAQSPSLPLSALVAELADERTRLDTLDTGDAATSVRTVFQWSYQQLSPSAARMFRLIGVHPGPDITVPAAASLAGLPVEETLACVRELVRANLLVEHVPGRFNCHDLLRVYAADRAAAEESAEARDAALERTFDHYLHTLIAVDANHHARHRQFVKEPVPLPGTSPEAFTELEAVHDWFRAERNVLRAVIAQSEAHGFDRHTWQLVWIAFDLVDRIGPWQDWMWALASAERAAARAGELERAAKMMFLEAVAVARLGRYEHAARRFAESGRAYAELGDVPGQVRCQSGLAWTLILRDRPHESLKTAQAALDLQRGDASATNELISMALHQVAEGLIFVGEYQKALECCAELETLRQGIENPYDSGHEAMTRGAILVRLDEFGQAVELLNQSIIWFNQVGSWSDIATAQRWLGEAYLGLGDFVRARRVWIESLEAWEYHQHPNAEVVRAHLAALPEN